MQPTIHVERKAGNRRSKYPTLPSQCIVGCIFNSVGRIIIREIFCIATFLETVKFVLCIIMDKQNIIM
jgi:hypothetical protein